MPRTIPRSMKRLARRLQNQPKGLEVECHMVPRGEQRSELGSDVYFGGAVFARHASLDPALYHQGLLDRAIAAGAAVHPRTPVTAIDGAARQLPV